MSIGKRIINLREKHNLSQRELATRLDINVSVMNRIESGERAIRDTELIKIAQIFNVKTDYLLGLTDSPTPIDDDEAEFISEITNPELKRWILGLPLSDEEDIKKLKTMWEIIKDDPKRK